MEQGQSLWGRWWGADEFLQQANVEDVVEASTWWKLKVERHRVYLRHDLVDP